MTDEQSKVLRIIDANLNRSMEAMRTIEEYTRFIINDRPRTETLKQMRHDLQQLAEHLPFAERILARNSVRDVGRSVTTETEYERKDVSHVVSASLGRLKQSLRSMEEYSKILDAEVGSAFEKLRYQTYDLEKDLVVQAVANEIFEPLTVYGLVAGGATLSEFESHVGSLLLAGIDVIQLRDKQLDDKTLLARARHLRKLIDGEIERAGRPVLMIVNDRPDICRISGADGVHLGQTEISLQDARQLLGNQFLIGISTHHPEQVEQAIRDGADYIGCGPTFPSTTKDFSDFPGPEFLTWVASNCSLPAFAIGGIDTDNIEKIATSGFRRVAVSGCIGPDSAHRRVIETLKNTMARHRLVPAD